MEFLIDGVLLAWVSYLTWRTHRRTQPTRPTSHVAVWSALKSAHQPLPGDGRARLRARLAEKAQKRAAK